MSYFNKNGEGLRRGRILFNNFLIDVDFNNPVRIRVSVSVRIRVRVRVRVGARDRIMDRVIVRLGLG